MTSDKFVYLFGRIIPALSLVLSMTLRFIPKFQAQIHTVSNAQRCVGRDVSDGSLLQRAKHGLTILSIMWQGTINWKILLSYYATGFPMDLVQAAATALFLWFLSQPMLEKLDRIKVKYGLVEPVCVLRSAPSGACVAAEGSSFPTEIF